MKNESFIFLQGNKKLWLFTWEENGKRHLVEECHARCFCFFFGIFYKIHVAEGEWVSETTMVKMYKSKTEWEVQGRRTELLFTKERPNARTEVAVLSSCFPSQLFPLLVVSFFPSIFPFSFLFLFISFPLKINNYYRKNWRTKNKKRNLHFLSESLSI